MLARATPAAMEVIARLDDSPRYRGSVHDDAVARSLGYRGALIPGAFVLGYISRMGVESWGRDFIERGTLAARFRRPVHAGDRLVVSAAALTETTAGMAARVTVVNGEGEEVATGSVGLNRRPPEIDPADWPVAPLPAEPPLIGPGGMPVGIRLGSRERVFGGEALRQSLDDFGETHPLYRETGAVHAGCLTRIGMAEAYANFRFTTPVILVALESEHLSAAGAGDRLLLSGTVAAAWERNGNHYFDSDELLIADGTRPVVRCRRTSIYAARSGSR